MRDTKIEMNKWDDDNMLQTLRDDEEEIMEKIKVTTMNIFNYKQGNNNIW